MWTFYDRLIDGIDEDIIVDRVASGSSWTVVTAGEYCGLSANIEGGRTAPDPYGSYRLRQDLYYG